MSGSWEKVSSKKVTFGQRSLRTRAYGKEHAEEPSAKTEACLGTWERVVAETMFRVTWWDRGPSRAEGP